MRSYLADARNFCLVKVLLWYCCDNTLGPWGHCDNTYTGHA